MRKSVHVYVVGGWCFEIIYFRGGQLIRLRGHFEKAMFGGGPYVLSEIEAGLG